MEVKRVAAQEILLPLLQIAEPHDVTAAPREPARFSAPGFRNNAFDDVLGVSLVEQVMAEHSAGIGEIRIEQQARGLEA